MSAPMVTNSCLRAISDDACAPCTCGGATCGGERDPLAEARGVVDVAGQHAMLLEMEPGGEVMTSVLRSLAALASAGLALREAARASEWTTTGDDGVLYMIPSAALDAFDAALADATGAEGVQG